MSVKNAQKLKQLQTRKAKLEVDIKELAKEVKAKQQEHDKAHRQLQAILREIQGLRDSEIVVSEHAIIRYLERAMEIDIEEIKSKILTSDNLIIIKNMGNGKYPISNGAGLKAVVKNNTVVSVS